MSDFFFISYSSVDGKDFAMKLADGLTAGTPSYHVWLAERCLRPGEDWDEQVVEAILPFRLGSRQYNDFLGSFDTAAAQLRKHLAFMGSPEGELRGLRYRLAESERRLPRAEPEQQVRIQQDIANKATDR